MQYHIWTFGCQMNQADSQLLASELEKMGHHAAEDHHDADILVVNTCVVRQSSEDKAYGRLMQLHGLKRQHPDKVIGIMGCLVGVKDPVALRKKLPYVDVFMSPSEPNAMLNFLRERNGEAEVIEIEAQERTMREQLQDGVLILPEAERGNLISAHVPIVYGCSHACTFCVIPFRRGVERSRSVGEIVNHVRSLAAQGVKEVTLLGQIVDRYGKDIPDGPDLAVLLRIVHQVAEEVDIKRIRFLTSHPNWMNDDILEAVAELPRLMPVIEVPVQAGNDAVLERMKRGYTNAQYRLLIERIRSKIPNVAIHTDIIVGFCGETEAEFMDTYNLLEDLKLDKPHLACYSPRPQTISERKMVDDVPEEEKSRRLQMLEAQHARLSAERNSQWLGQIVEVLVEDNHKGKWRGRTPHNKLVFFEGEGDFVGQLVNVEVTWTGPWSMQARLPQTVATDLSLPVLMG
jgi:tRNA-2-methylthio-N6-dimethylallyladenosine synthase